MKASCFSVSKEWSLEGFGSRLEEVLTHRARFACHQEIGLDRTVGANGANDQGLALRHERKDPLRLV